MAGKLVASDGYEVCLYPQNLVRITQSYAGGTSHKCTTITNTGCWDINQEVNNRTPIYAPFSCTCYKISYGAGNQCWLVSDDKVHYPNTDYKDALGKLVFSFGHCNDSYMEVSDGDYFIEKPQHINQGEIVGYTGNKGADSIHSHLILNVGYYEYPTTYQCWSTGLQNWLYYAPNAIDLDFFFYFNNTDYSDGSKYYMKDGSGITLTCKWYNGATPTDKYSLTLTASGNGSVDPSGTTYHDKNSSVKITATAGSGATFKNWSDGNTNATRYITMNSNKSLTAYFTGDTPTPTDKYKVTLNVEPSGSGYTTGQGEYSYNERAWLEGHANEGYEFEKWSDGYTGNPRYWDITNDLTLTAYFKVKTFTINASYSDEKGNANVGGEISGTGTFNYGTSHSVIITADKQYVIQSIKVNGNEVLTTSQQGKITSYTYTISSIKQDYNIVVTFAKKGILITGYGGMDFQIL